MNTGEQKTAVIYRPFERFDKNVISCFIGLCAASVRSRELIFQLARREFFAEYKVSFIGGFWIILSPLAAVVSWLFLHRAHILRAGDVGVPYAAYVLIGSTMWGFFMSLYRTASITLQSSRYLIMNIALPHEAVFVAPMLVKAVDFAFSVLITAAVIAFFGIVPSWHALLLPLVVVPLFLFSASIGLIACLISAVSYDFSRALSYILGLVMFATPVVYSLDAIGSRWLRLVVMCNPLTYLVCSARDIILFGTLYYPGRFFVSSAAALCMFIFAWRVFYITENRIVERML